MQISTKTLFLATGLAVSCMGFAQDLKPSFTISISAPSTLKAGSSAILYITLTNISNRSITLSTGNDTEGEMNFDIDVRDSEGKRAVSRPEAWPLSGHLGHVNLKPGEKLKSSADIGKLFDIKPGTYRIQLSRSEGADRLLPHDPASVDLQQPAPIGPVIKSNTLPVTVVP
ncbi:MAG: hypothetical protein WAK89_04375 [Candidatus Sulfotelmatobacter sp.]